LETGKKIPASRQGGHPEHNLILTPGTIKYIMFGKESQAEPRYKRKMKRGNKRRKKR